jgi:RNA polymerase sigma factor (sigma-70 family)
MPNNYQEMIFQVLAERTQNFQFDGISNEPESASEDELRQLRLKDLIAKVIKMGVRIYYKSPEHCRNLHTKEDWIQEAIVIFIQHVEEYDPNRGKEFNRFILFRVKKRLIDRLRTLCGEKNNGKPPDPNGTTKTGSPEDECIKKERRKILWNCVKKLNTRESKMFFIRHEIQGIPLQRLYDDLEIDKIGNVSLSSVETFRRHYKQKIFNKVRDCVLGYFYRDHYKCFQGGAIKSAM